MVCPYKEFLEWNIRECLFGECEMCGIENLLVYPIEEEALSNSVVSWKCFSLGKIVTKKEEGGRKTTTCVEIYIFC